MVFLDYLLLLLLIVLAVLLLDYVLSRGWLSRRDSLAGQLVVITGAGGGLGFELSLQFARRGAILALWDNRPEGLEALCDWLTSHGVATNAVRTLCIDVSDASAVDRAAEEQLKELGAARVVINNAAIVNGGPLLGRGNATEGAIRSERAFRVNTLAHYHSARAFLPQMLEKGVGTMVTVGSVMADLPAAGLTEYCASKAGLSQFHGCLRWELRANSKPHRVHCLLVKPFLMDTPLFAGGSPVRFAWLRGLFPPLRAVDVATRIVEAVETRRESLVLPWHLKWVPPILQLIPLFLRDAILDVGGARTAMHTYTGRT